MQRPSYKTEAQQAQAQLQELLKLVAPLLQGKSFIPKAPAEAPSPGEKRNCPRCNGSKAVHFAGKAYRCYTCNGKGEVGPEDTARLLRSCEKQQEKLSEMQALLAKMPGR